MLMLRIYDRDVDYIKNMQCIFPSQAARQKDEVNIRIAVVRTSDARGKDHDCSKGQRHNTCTESSEYRCDSSSEVCDAADAPEI